VEIRGHTLHFVLAKRSPGWGYAVPASRISTAPAARPPKANRASRHAATEWALRSERARPAISKKIVQAIGFILSRAPGRKINKLHLLKLIYLADRYHLRKYGRTVTGDTYYAMSYGPVPSLTKDVVWLKAEPEYVGRFFTCRPENKNVCELTRSTDVDELSQTDLDALNCAMEQLWLHDDIVGFTHEFSEWKNCEERLKTAPRIKMNMLDFFLHTDNPKSEYCAVSPDLVDLKREIYEATPVKFRR
jgi:hypothetical protein